MTSRAILVWYARTERHRSASENHIITMMIATYRFKLRSFQYMLVDCRRPVFEILDIN